MATCNDCIHVDVCRGIYLTIISGEINSYEEFLEKCEKEHFEQQDIFPCDCLFYKDRARYQIATSTDETVENLKPLAKPHGRLIDADKLMQWIEHVYGDKGIIKFITDDIKRQPTIIEAEVSE